LRNKNTFSLLAEYGVIWRLGFEKYELVYWIWYWSLTLPTKPF